MTGLTESPPPERRVVPMTYGHVPTLDADRAGVVCLACGKRWTTEEAELVTEPCPNQWTAMTRVRYMGCRAFRSHPDGPYRSGSMMLWPHQVAFGSKGMVWQRPPGASE